LTAHLSTWTVYDEASCVSTLFAGFAQRIHFLVLDVAGKNYLSRLDAEQPFLPSDSVMAFHGSPMMPSDDSIGVRYSNYKFCPICTIQDNNPSRGKSVRPRVHMDCLQTLRHKKKHGKATLDLAREVDESEASPLRSFAISTAKCCRPQKSASQIGDKRKWQVSRNHGVCFKTVMRFTDPFSLLEE
jgi:hypothetical protein